MKFILISLTVSIAGCFITINNKQVLFDQDFEEVIVAYVKENRNIENKCSAKPFYKVYFNKTDKDIGFWIGAHLGIPSLVVPVKPGSNTPANPIEIKGVFLIDSAKVVIYDYKESGGYGLYDQSKLEEFNTENFDSLSDECTNVWYPEALYYTLTKDSIYVTDKRESFKLK